MTGLVQELRRRNVFRVGAAYVVVSWIAIQIVNEISEPLSLPQILPTLVIVLLGIGFPIALIFAWAFELTPEGLKKTDEVEETASVAAETGQKLTYFIIGALVLALAYFVWESRLSEQPAQIDMSVAVLPFADLSENGDQKWFSDGLTEEILNSLAALPELKVTARTSAFVFDGQDRDVGEVAEILGVAYVVEGSVRRIGERLRVTAQLIRAEDGFHMWSETYDSTADDLFTVQTDVAEKIATALDVFLDDGRREQMFAGGTRNVEAFEAYLLGRELLTQVHAFTTDKNLWDANVFFEKAMALDPNFGEPSIMHHDAFAHFVLDGKDGAYVAVEGESPFTQEEAMSFLLADLDNAARNASSPVTRLIGEMVREFFSPSWNRMGGLTERSRDVVDPEKVDFWSSTWLPNILMINGELELLREINEVRLKTDPLDPTSWARMAELENTEGNFDAARDLIKRGRAVAGDHVWLRRAELLAAVNSRNGEEAITLMEAHKEDVAPYAPYKPHLAAMRGDYAKATELAEGEAATTSWPIEGLLMTYHETGDSERAAELTRRIDALPAGAVIFVRLISTTGNRIMFDLEHAPNFSARLREADIDPESFPVLPRLSMSAQDGGE